MLLNQQKAYAMRLPDLEAYVREMKRRLRLGTREFNICFVDDAAMRRINAAFRGKHGSTDVLSFPWGEPDRPQSAAGGTKRNPSRLRRTNSHGVGREFEGFLGDVVISAETARRNAREEGHSTLTEIRWLILHGVLHLLGYDHEYDDGEMATLELVLREQLAGVRGRRSRIR
jgi:probable rRNA maturation factor